MSEKPSAWGLEGKTEFAMEEQVWPFGSARGGGDPGPRQVRILQKHAIYAGMVESMDRSVGLVLDKLKSLGIDDRTVVCFTSDNGDCRPAKDCRLLIFLCAAEKAGPTKVVYESPSLLNGQELPLRVASVRSQ